MLALATAALLSCGAARADDTPILKDPILTPGAIDLAATVIVVCNGTTKHRRSVSPARNLAVAAAYGIPSADVGVRYEMDHLIPLAIGGSNVAANLWPQPWPEAEKNEVLEVELQRQVCLGLVTQAQAQRDIAEDWVEAYRHYVLNVTPPPPRYRHRHSASA